MAHKPSSVINVCGERETQAARTLPRGIARLSCLVLHRPDEKVSGISIFKKKKMQFLKQWPELNNKVNSQGRGWANYFERPVLPSTCLQLRKTDSRGLHPLCVYTALGGTCTHFFFFLRFYLLVHERHREAET